MTRLDRLAVGFDVSPLAAERSGIGRYAWELLAALWASGEHDVVPIGHGRVPLPAGSSRQVQGPRFPSRSAWTFGLLPIWLRRAGLDLFHATSYYAPVRAGVPTVVTVHDLGLFVHPEFHPRARILRARAVLPRVAHAAAAVIVPSRSVRGEVVTRLGVAADRVHVVPEAPAAIFSRPVSEERRAGTLARYGLAPGYFLAVGALEPRKNLERTVQALATLPGGDARLVVAGPCGWMFEPAMDRVRGLHLRDRVRFLGFVPDEDLVALMAGAVALVYPSLYEGFGLPVVEAMAAGLPVITSDTDAIAEVAGDAALLVDPHDDEGIAMAMGRLLDDPELRARLAEVGHARAAEYSWSRTAAETMAVYGHALGEARRHAAPSMPAWGFAPGARMGALEVRSGSVLAAGATPDAPGTPSASNLAPEERNPAPTPSDARTRARGANRAEKAAPAEERTRETAA